MRGNNDNVWLLVVGDIHYFIGDISEISVNNHGVCFDFLGYIFLNHLAERVSG
jgi:hypothetical protein